MNITDICELSRNLGCTVKLNEPLKGHCSFKVGGLCSAFIEINSERTLCTLINEAKKNNLRYLTIGRGSNIIFDDKGFDGIIFHLENDMSEIRLIDECTVFAEAGVSLMKLCMFALENSLSGLEFAYGIPGSVGGAVFMNAGAYDGEIENVIVSADVIENDLIKKYEKKDMELSYRHSRFMDNDCIITSAVFKLKKADKKDIKSKMDDLMERRKSKQPLEYPSAGSTFKRPEGQFAGKLIQDCELKGVSVGGAQVSEKHSGFIINKNNATSEDIMKLIKLVQNTVKQKTGYFLECEVRYIPYV